MPRVPVARRRSRACPQIPALVLVACSLLSGLGFLSPGKLYAQFPTEKPKGYVNDFAGVLSPAAQQELENLCKELDEKTKAQLAIVTVKSLQGRPLEEFTIDLATRWGIGPKGSDRGVMLFLAIQDRRSRIEVGYGLEPIITDGRAGDILRSMTPYLKNGDYDGALLLGASSIAQTIAKEAGVPISAPSLPAAPASWLWVKIRPYISKDVLFILALFLGFLLWRVTLTVAVLSSVYALLTEIHFPLLQFLIVLVGATLIVVIMAPPFCRSHNRKRDWIKDFLGWTESESSGGSGESFGGGFGGFGGGAFGGGGASGSW